MGGHLGQPHAQPRAVVQEKFERFGEIADTQLVEGFFGVEPRNDTGDLASEKVHGDETFAHWLHPAQQLAITTAAVFDPVAEHAKQLNRAQDGGVKLVLDLHDIYNRSGDIDRALRDIIDEAIAKKAPLVEIIPGKGSGALKKRVLRFLAQPEIKAQYHRVEKDSKNFGRVFVHFKTK